MSPSDKANHRDKEELRELASKLQLAVDASRMGIWDYDEAAQQVHWDDRMLEIYGITDGQNLRTDDYWARHIHPDDLEVMLQYAEDCRRTKSNFQRDYRIVLPNGETRYIRSLARNIQPGDGPSRFIGVNIDMTEDHERAEELKKARNQLKHDARHDVLTGLGNRRRLDEVTKELFDTMAQTDSYCVVLMDLDHFKQVNDTLGHLAGDFILQSVAAHFTATFSPLGKIFRIGGDEFAVLFPQAPREALLISMCETIVSQVSKPMTFEGEDCAIGLSIGYAFGQGRPTNPNEIFTNADAALYAAKRNGRSGTQAYHPALKKKSATVSNARSDLLNAMQTNALICYYQPQYDAHTRHFVGAEALIRWNCPNRGLLHPYAFLPQAYENGLTAAIDEHVLGIVTAQQSIWAAQNLPYPAVSVNICTQRLCDPQLIDHARKTIEPHHKITFELKGTADATPTIEETRHALHQLRALGIGIDLDSFG